MNEKEAMTEELNKVLDLLSRAEPYHGHDGTSEWNITCLHDAVYSLTRAVARLSGLESGIDNTYGIPEERFVVTQES